MKRTKLSLVLVAAIATLTLLGHVSADSTPAPAAAGSTLQQRVDQRKAERAITLNDADSKRLVSTCVNAQGKIRLIQSDAATMLETHSKVYQTVDARLWNVIGSLKFAKQDTFQLQKERQALSDKTDSFQTLGNNYKQTLDDLVVINCQGDPVGFKALLETARIYYAQLKTQTDDSRDYIINTLKPTLTGHTNDLQTKSSSEGN